MSRYCEQCGAKLEAGENFCPSCGVKVITNALPPQTPQPDPPTSSADNNYDNLMKFGVATLMILILIGAVFQYQKSQEKTSWTYSPPETSTPVDTKPKTPAALNESDLSIGNVALNLDKSYIDKQIGTGKSKDDDWYDYGDFWAKFDSDNKVYWLSCMSANLNTVRGIHVGSTLDELERAYDITQFRKETADKTVNYECDLRGMTLIFSVLKSSNSVDEIVLVKKVQKTNPPTEKTKTPAEKPQTYDEYNYSCTVNGEKTYKGISRRGLACALYSVEKQKRITSDFGSNHTARGTFYIVTIIVGNNTNEPIFSPLIYLIDEHGRKFSSDTSAESTWEIMYGVEGVYQLNPNQPGWIYKVFDIPDDATIVNLRCEASLSIDGNKFDVPFRVVTE